MADPGSSTNPAPYQGPLAGEVLTDNAIRGLAQNIMDMAHDGYDHLFSRIENRRVGIDWRHPSCEGDWHLYTCGHRVRAPACCRLCVFPRFDAPKFDRWECPLCGEEDRRIGSERLLFLFLVFFHEVWDGLDRMNEEDELREEERRWWIENYVRPFIAPDVWSDLWRLGPQRFRREVWNGLLAEWHFDGDDVPGPVEIMNAFLRLRDEESRPGDMLYPRNLSNPAYDEHDDFPGEQFYEEMTRADEAMNSARRGGEFERPERLSYTAYWLAVYCHFANEHLQMIGPLDIVYEYLEDVDMFFEDLDRHQLLEIESFLPDQARDRLLQNMIHALVSPVHLFVFARTLRPFVIEEDLELFDAIYADRAQGAAVNPGRMYQMMQRIMANAGAGVLETLHAHMLAIDWGEPILIPNRQGVRPPEP